MTDPPSEDGGLKPIFTEALPAVVTKLTGYSGMVYGAEAIIFDGPVRPVVVTARILML